MKKFLIALVALIATTANFGAVALNDVKIAQNISTTPMVWADKFVSPAANSVFTFNGSLVPTASTTLLLAAGSAAEPSHSFTGQVDAGMFLKSATAVGIAAGGTEAISIASAGVTVTGNLTATGNGTHTIGSTNTVTITSGEVTAVGGYVVGGGAFAAGKLYGSAAGGTTLSGKAGSALDLNITNPAGLSILTVPTGTLNLVAAGTLTATDYLLGTGRSFTSAINARQAASGLVMNGTGGVTISGVAAFGTNSATLSAAVNFPSFAAIPRIFSANSAYQGYVDSDGTTKFYTVGGTVTGPRLTAGQTHNVAVVVHGNGTATIYVDGTAGTTGPITADLVTEFNSVGYAGTVYATGTIGRTQIFNYAKTAAEVAALWQDGRAPGADYPSAVAGTTLNSSAFVAAFPAYTTHSSETTSGFAATSDGSTVHYEMSQAVFSVKVGDVIRVTYDLTLNSGTAPSMRIAEVGVANLSASVVATAGTGNVVDFTITAASSSAVVQIYNANTTTDFVIANFSATHLGLVLSPDLTAGTGTTAYPEAGTSGSLTWSTGVSWATPKGTTVPFTNITATGQISALKPLAADFTSQTTLLATAQSVIGPGGSPTPVKLAQLWRGGTGNGDFFISSDTQGATQYMSFGYLSGSTTLTAFKFDQNYGNAIFAGSVETSSTAAFVIGDPATDGSWQFIRSGNNLVVQRRESSAWVTKGTWTP